MFEQFRDFPYILAYIALGIVVIVIAKVLYDFFTNYKLDHELTQEDNPAVGISVSGYFIALIIIISKLVPHVNHAGDYSASFAKDIFNFAIYAVLGIVLLNISRMIVDKLILFKFQINKELIEDKNSGTGLVLAGSYIASGLVIAAAISGNPDEAVVRKAFGNEFDAHISGLLLSFVFFALGQITFIIYSFVYEWLSPYKVQKEIEKDNVAAGLSFGGGILALGVILYSGIAGDFKSWAESITYFVWLAVFAIIALPSIRWFVSKIMLPKADLTEEIIRDRNINAALLEIICLNMVSAIVLYGF